MKKTVAELKQERASKIDAQGKMLETLKAENRDFNETEQTHFDTLETEIGTLKEQIKRAETMEEAAKRAAALKIDEPGKGAQQRGANDAKKQFSVARAILGMIDDKAIPAEDRAYHDQALNELRASGITEKGNKALCIPASEMRNYSVTGDSGAKGGELVSTEVRPELPFMPTLKLQSLGVDVITGAVGNLKFPTTDNLSFGFYDENEKVTGVDSDFNGPTAKPKRLAGTIYISRQLLLQTNADAMIMKMIYNGIDNAALLGAINGAGGNEPDGLLNVITTNDLSGTPGLPTHKQLIALKSKIKTQNAPTGNLSYLFDAEMEGELETTKKDAGSGSFLIENNKCVGRSYNVSTLMPVLNTGTHHPIICGAWSALKFITWSGVQLMVDPYSEADAGLVKITVNFYCDALVTNEKAFSVKTDVTIS